MKILILTNNLHLYSGWGRYSADLISGIRKAGHEVVILTEDDEQQGIQILTRGMGMFYSALRVRKYIKKCDVIHALDINPYAIIAWLANLFVGKPLIITAVGSYSIAPFHNWKTRWLVRSACQSARGITAISRFVASRLEIATGRKDIQVINPGIDVQKFHRNHVSGGAPYILSVGALKQRKGYHVSIPAFALAKMKIPNLHYIIVGSQRDSGYFRKLRDLVDSCGVLESVQFLTDVTDEQLAGLYQKAEAFILTSVNDAEHFEGYGLVFLEAAAAGLPAIGTLGNGIEDAVGNENGVLVPQNDITETAKALVHILGNPEVWQKMSQASYRWAQEHTLDDPAKKYALVYDQIAG